ncbi:hypothetical protein DFQ28_008270 [Apophysomyces sp. BC1034]|nr:hypothetical protein DFQ30_008009 [Apophysomyces sp. BC1015]KAG0175671.1 hypothetical protein DFQ29_007072 [Apophysomyces sp. BC1021]KAG0186128.1 hypothetical protein DFQ28_008270 [Apophysomyces sp. BC1034]
MAAQRKTPMFYPKSGQYLLLWLHIAWKWSDFSPKNKFKDFYDDASINRRIQDNERKAQMIGYSNTVQLTVIGGKNYQKKMAKASSSDKPCKVQDKEKDTHLRKTKMEPNAHLIKDTIESIESRPTNGNQP